MAKSKFKEGERVRYRLGDTTLSCVVKAVSDTYFEGGNGRLYKLVTECGYDLIDIAFKRNRRSARTEDDKLLFWGCDVSLRPCANNSTIGW